MSIIKTLGLGFLALFFIACQDGVSPKEENLSKCESPKYQILFDTTKISGSQDIYSVQDFKALLGKMMQDSQCFSFVQTPNESIWKIEVYYKLEVNAQNQDFNIAKGQSEATLKSLVTLDLIQQKQSIKERANGELKLSKNHYFGTGKESKISKTEIERLLRQNILFIIDDLAQR